MFIEFNSIMRSKLLFNYHNILNTNFPYLKDFVLHLDFTCLSLFMSSTLLLFSIPTMNSFPQNFQLNIMDLVV